MSSRINNAGIVGFGRNASEAAARINKRALLAAERARREAEIAPSLYGGGNEDRPSPAHQPVQAPEIPGDDSPSTSHRPQVLEGLVAALISRFNNPEQSLNNFFDISAAVVSDPQSNGAEERSSLAVSIQPNAFLSNVNWIVNEAYRFAQNTEHSVNNRVSGVGATIVSANNAVIKWSSSLSSTLNTGIQQLHGIENPSEQVAPDNIDLTFEANYNDIDNYMTSFRDVVKGDKATDSDTFVDQLPTIVANMGGAFQCPILSNVSTDPVIIPGDTSHTIFDRKYITRMIQRGQVHPTTRQSMHVGPENLVSVKDKQDRFLKFMSTEFKPYVENLRRQYAQDTQRTQKINDAIHHIDTLCCDASMNSSPSSPASATSPRNPQPRETSSPLQGLTGKIASGFKTALRWFRSFASPSAPSNRV
jgi:hypothetical protein